MKKIVFLLIGLSLISCSTTKSSTSKTIDVVGSGVIHKPTVVDLDVNPTKASKTVEFKNMLSLDNAKNEIVSQLLKDRSADILVEPTFESITKNGNTQLTVNGYTASYKNFRTIKEEDVKFLEMKPNLTTATKTYEPIITKKNNNALWITIGAVVLTGLMLGSSLK